MGVALWYDFKDFYPFTIPVNTLLEYSQGCRGNISCDFLIKILSLNYNHF